MKTSIKALVILLIATAASGCTRHDYMAEGRKALASHHYAVAEIYFRKAIQKKPASDKAYFELGQALLKEQQFDHAYAAFYKAAELNPANDQAQAKIGDFMIAAKKPYAAERIARGMLKRNPSSLLGGVLVGEAFAAQHDFDHAQAALEKVARKYPKSAAPLVPLAAVEFSKGHPDKGVQNLDEAIRLDPHSTPAYMLKASYLRSVGENAKALAVLRSGASANPYDATLNLALAQTLVSSKKTFPEGEKMLATMAQKGPAKIQAQSHLALLDVNLKKLSAAEKLLQQLNSEQHGSDQEVIYARARLLIARNKMHQAHKELLNLVKLAPKFGPAYYYLGVTAIALKNWQEALQDLRTASQFSPRNSTAFLLISALELNHHNFESSLTDSNRALELNSNDIAAMAIRGESLMERHHFEEARQEFLKIKHLAPKAPLAYQQLGQIGLAQKNYKEAITEFEAALKRGPSLAPALQGLAFAITKTEGRQSAIKRIRLQIKAVPKNAQFHALLGDYLAQASKFEEAIAEYNRALALSPTDLIVHNALASAYERSGSPAKARQALETALQKDPNFVPALMAIGQLDDKEGHPHRAAARYEKVLASHPDFAPAANNLAWDYLETNQNLDQALRLAQRARSLMPTNLNAADTLAAIFLKRGMPANAEPLLRQCIAQQPDMAIAHYHMALALLALKHNGKAKKEFDTVIALAPGTPLAAKAQASLKSISNASGQSQAKT